MSFDIKTKSYHQDFGPIYACLFSLKLFIEDNKNEMSLRKKAKDLWEWFDGFEVEVDDIAFLRGYEMCLFMIDVLEKYPLTNKNNSNFVMKYDDAYDPLKITNYAYDPLKITNDAYDSLISQYDPLKITNDAYDSLITQKNYYLANGLDKIVKEPVKPKKIKCSMKKGKNKKDKR